MSYSVRKYKDHHIVLVTSKYGTNRSKRRRIKIRLKPLTIAARARSGNFQDLSREILKGRTYDNSKLAIGLIRCLLREQSKYVDRPRGLRNANKKAIALARGKRIRGL